MKLCPLPKGDVIATRADTTALYKWIDFSPSTSIEEGMKKFLDWFRTYYL